MADAGGPVQLAELGVSPSDTLIDGGGQAEGGVQLQEEDAGQRRAAKSSDTERRQRKSSRRFKDPAGVFSCLLPPSETRCRGA